MGVRQCASFCMIAGGICASGVDSGPVIPATAVAPNVKPSIKLTGPATLSLDSGEPFAKCDATAKLDTICDRGATATDEEDGKHLCLLCQRLKCNACRLATASLLNCVFCCFRVR